MEFDYRRRTLQADAIVSVQTANNFLISHKTFKVDEFFAAMQQRLGRNEQWFTEGVECEILTPGQHWQKGKVKIRLEFYLEEALSDEVISHTLEKDEDKDGSPLDEIRLGMQADS